MTQEELKKARYYRFNKNRSCMTCKEPITNISKTGKCHPCFSKSRPLNDGLRKYANNNKNQKHHLWKGDKVGYHGIHDWIYKIAGSPRSCEKCGKDNLTGHKIHWANVSGSYKRKRNDWIRLCVKCHRKFDKSTRAMGEALGISKLNSKQVEKIRFIRKQNPKITLRIIGEIFGVSATNVSDIVNRKIWKHV